MTVTATLFLIVAIMHLLRIIFGWQVEIGGLSIPFWVSWLAVPVDDALAYFGFTAEHVADAKHRGRKLKSAGDVEITGSDEGTRKSGRIINALSAIARLPHESRAASYSGFPVRIRIGIRLEVSMTTSIR